MDGYVSKPVRQPELLSAMSQLIPHLFVDRSAADHYLAAQAAKSSASNPTSAVFAAPAANLEAGREPAPAIEAKARTTAPAMKTPPPQAAALPISNAQAVVPTPAAPLPPPEPATAKPAAAPARPLFDADAMMENLGNDMAMLAEVVVLCRENDTPRLLAELAQSIQNGDADTAAKAAHALKGLVGAFNANDAWAAAKLLEMTARAGKLDALKDEADEFVRTLRALLVSLETFAGIEHSDIHWV
jgi:HPt (histidine-containing phosphotransfer) domain-containing protein